uniref:Legume lectin domain-containing protein n=1 Tax=Populus trichocarpa TaxID=3694 RepID=U5G846_POPTR
MPSKLLLMLKEIRSPFFPDVHALYRKQFKLWAGKGRVRATLNSTFVLGISPQTKPGGEGITFILTADSGLPENRRAMAWYRKRDY